MPPAGTSAGAFPALSGVHASKEPAVRRDTNHEAGMPKNGVFLTLIQHRGLRHAACFGTVKYKWIPVAYSYDRVAR